MWELDRMEAWALKNWCFQVVVLENTLESPLDCREIKPVSPKGNQLWIFIGRMDAEAPILLSRAAKSLLIRKDPDVGKDWRQRRGGWQRMRWLDSITDSMDINFSKLSEDRGAWNSVVHGVAKSQTWLSYWTMTIHGNDYHIPVSHLTPN